VAGVGGGWWWLLVVVDPLLAGSINEWRGWCGQISTAFWTRLPDREVKTKRPAGARRSHAWSSSSTTTTTTAGGKLRTTGTRANRMRIAAASRELSPAGRSKRK
jgi:hypothetical protein